LLDVGSLALLEAMLLEMIIYALGQGGPVVGAGRSVESSPTPTSATGTLSMVAPGSATSDSTHDKTSLLTKVPAWCYILDKSVCPPSPDLLSLEGYGFAAVAFFFNRSTSLLGINVRL